MGKDYINPPSREDFEYFKDFSNLQIVILCEFELLRTDKRFKPDDPKQLLNRYIVNWKKNEFKELSTQERSSFQVDLQRILPFIWSKVFPEFSDKNHLNVFKNELTEDELKKIDEIISNLMKDWEEKFSTYETMNWITDKEITMKWDSSKDQYVEV